MDICSFDDVLSGHNDNSTPNHIVLTDFSIYSPQITLFGYLRATAPIRV